MEGAEEIRNRKSKVKEGMGYSHLKVEFLQPWSVSRGVDQTPLDPTL